MKYHVGDMILEGFKVRDILMGSFGIVYVVQKENMIWAVKSFRDKYFEREEVIKDFYQEAEVWMKLGRHENIVEAFSVLKLDYKPHIFMEYADGGTLRERLQRDVLSIRESLFFAIQFCNGMMHANNVDLGQSRKGIVHRDIKPENIMLMKGGVLKITDFGLVKALGGLSGERLAGTVEYMSPEQFVTMDVDTRSDIYSFGIVLYEMLTGRTPFYVRAEQAAERWFSYMKHHKETEPKSLRQISPLMPEALEEIVLRCLKKEPDERYQGFEILRNDLLEAYRSMFGQVPKVEKRIDSLTEIEMWLKGSSLVELGKPEEAIPFLDMALEMNPSEAPAWLHKGRALADMGRQSEAIKCYDKALEINPRDAEAWSNKGVSLAGLGRHVEAIECYDKALEINPKFAVAWHNRAVSLFDLDKFEEALECCNRSLELNPSEVAAWHCKGTILANIGMYLRAIECYDRALEINPREARAWCNKGICLANLGRRGEALKCFQKAAELEPSLEEKLVEFLSS